MRLFLYLTLIGMGFAAPAVEKLQDQVDQLQQIVEQQGVLLQHFAKTEAERNVEKPAICEYKYYLRVE